MSSAHSQAQSSGLQERAPQDTFILFPQLPAELRLQIWESSFVPQRYRMPDQWNNRHSSQYSQGFMAVNHEARKVFMENHNLVFGAPNGPMFSPARDIVCIEGYTEGLYTLLTLAPDIMKQVRFIEIHVVVDRQTPAIPPRNRAMEDTTSLSSQCLLTVKWDLIPTTLLDIVDQDPYGKYIINELAFQQINLKRSHGATKYTGPKLAAIFPRCGAFRHNIYFESSDLKHASFGRILLEDDDDFEALQKPFKIKWTAKNVDWPVTRYRSDENIPTYKLNDVFGKLYNSRVPQKYEHDIVHNFRQEYRKFRAGNNNIRGLVSSQLSYEYWVPNPPIVLEWARRREDLLKQYADRKDPLLAFASTVDGELLKMHEQHKNEELGTVESSHASNSIEAANTEDSYASLRNLSLSS